MQRCEYNNGRFLLEPAVPTDSVSAPIACVMSTESGDKMSLIQEVGSQFDIVSNKNHIVAKLTYGRIGSLNFRQ